MRWGWVGCDRDHSNPSSPETITSSEVPHRIRGSQPKRGDDLRPEGTRVEVTHRTLTRGEDRPLLNSGPILHRRTINLIQESLF